MRYEFLSYALAEGTTPVYGGAQSIAIQTRKSIAQGDAANVFSFTMENHWGTHVDAPNHFFNNGMKISEYSPEFWFFKNPQVMRVSLQPSGVIRELRGVNTRTDLLLIQSDWCKLRHEEAYVKENPGIAPDVGFYLRKQYPHLRAVGLDWISVSPYADRQLGRLTHRAFLDPDGQNAPILLIEDMNLSMELASLREVAVFPLRIEALDSAPCTAVGLFSD
ncbi:cyclase family protein [Candidatus Magnetominusculus dajiuhuensis]|uniref:cyclase family protein n=1 Tax=Candidatus Magnetominusculus dajiuhuensis TaxID=3137712 RepID=UPI003B436270